jgi:uncharacterized protein YhaN
MRLHTAEIDRYGPLTSCRPDCTDGITVIAGPNESGKTLYLEGLLQLLDPDVAGQLSPGPRVDEAPTGRLEVTVGDDVHTLGNGTALSDISPVDPVHLHNLFVVRDSDLRLPDDQRYYTSLVEHLGDIHTSEINRLRDELVDTGRVTPEHLNISNSQQYNSAKAVRNEAAALADDIEAYLDEIAETGIAEQARQRLEVTVEREDVRQQLARQRTAKAVADYAEAIDQLETYREATTDLEDLEPFDQTTLDELRALNRDITNDEEQLETTVAELEAKRDELDTQESELGELRREQTELEQRQSDVEAVETALEEYRGATAETAAAESTLRQRRLVTIGGLLGGGLAAGGGAIAGSTLAIAAGIVLLVAGIVAWYSHRRLASQVSAADQHEQALLEAARDAGFEVDDPDAVAPAIRSFTDSLESVSEAVQRVEAERDATSDRIDELADERDSLRAAIDEQRADLEKRLTAVGVDSIEAYANQVDVKGDAHERRERAAQYLTREVGEPDAADPADRIAAWEEQLAEMQADIADVDVAADEYDEATLERLQARDDELTQRLDDLEADLEAHREQLDEFERRANSLQAGPFIDGEITLQARTPAGLERLAADLSELVDAIEHDAETSRKAIGILETIRDDEEEKLTTLFDPDGAASTVFARLTDGRYTAVDYDPDETTLTVTTSGGQTLPLAQLSRGTQDQLYFAARLSLAGQLLGGEPGFLLLDDPFLAADHDRLHRGFETLSRLSDEGWQIVYCTAKPEVHEGMAETFDLPVHDLSRLSH